MTANDRLGNLPERLGPVAARFVDYWLTLPKQACVPARADLDPAAFRDVLPYFTISGINRGHDAKWRLVGPGIREWFGRELTRHDVLEIHDDGAKAQGRGGGLGHGRAALRRPGGSWRFIRPRATISSSR